MNKSLKKQVWLNVDYQVYGQFFGQSGVRVYGRICTKIWDEVRTHVYNQVFQAKDSLHQVIKKKDNIKMRTSKSLKNQVWHRVRGQVSVNIEEQVHYRVFEKVSDQVNVELEKEKLREILCGISVF